MSANCFRYFSCFLVGWCFLIHTVRAQGLYEQFQKSWSQKDYTTCIKAGSRLVQYVNHPFLHYQLAECYAGAGKRDSSLQILRQLASQGLPYRVEENGNLQSLKEQATFTTISNQFIQNRSGKSQPLTAFVLNTERLIPEGITANRKGTAFYIGSYAKRSIIRRSDDREEVFLPEGAEGMFGVLGMKLSPDEKDLWVCTSSEQEGTAGFAGLFVFDVASKKLKRKIVLEKKDEPHLLNDLAFDQHGTAYITDSRAGKVWKVNDTGLQRVSNKDFIYPNGIAFHATTGLLYVADYTGITVIDPLTETTTALQAAVPTYLSSIDGLSVYRISLIAIQNAGDDQYRVVEFCLDESGRKITRVRTLAGHQKNFEMPTTGVVVGQEFYFIANSYVRNLQPDGSIKDVENIKPTIIQKLGLD